MAFPVDAARVGTNGSTAAVSKVCNLPTGIASGDRLVLELRSAAADTNSIPTGWTALALNVDSDASNDVVSIFWRLADGAEGATVTVSGTASVKFAAICWRITGAGTPQIGAVATGASAVPDPPSFTPTGGAQDYLWLWVGSWEGEQTSPPAGNPTNYSNPFGAATGEGGAIATNCRAAGATRQFNAATEDPPSWTISVSDDWTAFTVVVPPGGATFFQTLAATAIGVPSLTKGVFKTLAATAIGVPGLTKGMFKTLAATAVGVPTLATALITSVSMAATSVGVATMTRVVIFAETLAATAVGVATMTTQFIAGAGAAVRRLYSQMRGGRGRGRGR